MNADTFKDIDTPEAVKHLVDTFYNRVNKDKLLAPVFNDVAAVDWKTHLPRMYSFWEGVLLGKSNFTGNPMLKHIQLSRETPMSAAHFEKWLSLWEQTIQENFSGLKADLAVDRARAIGLLMQHKIAQFGGS